MLPVVRARLDNYAILEVTPSADPAEISAAFRCLAWRHHPDRNPAPGSTLQFQDINQAHQVLSDPARRAEYDAQWHAKPADHRPPARPATPPRPRRSWRRRRQPRAVPLTLFAGLLVSSAWAVIFTAMSVARSRSFTYAFGAPPALDTAPLGAAFPWKCFPSPTLTSAAAGSRRGKPGFTTAGGINRHNIKPARGTFDWLLPVFPLTRRTRNRPPSAS